MMVYEQQSGWFGLWAKISREDLNPLPAPKVFKPKFDLPQLSSYKGRAPSWFWAGFPSNLQQPAKSLVHWDRLLDLATETGYPDKVTLAKVVKDLKEGADIGCRGSFRDPTRATNAPSAYTDGRKVTDAICSWIHSGFCYGPVDMNLVPKTAKFSGIMTRPKPNGSARIILNLSAPKNHSVNEGIEAADFPAVMSSTTKWLIALNKAGKGCLMVKHDWAEAYKHIAVRLEDTDLQYFSWLGKAFKELCLIFGGVSSAGIFDRLAKIVHYIVKVRAAMPDDQSCQHLDDCVAAGAPDRPEIFAFDEEFFKVAAQVGVKLAPRDDPEKSFGPSTAGIVLGVHYDTVSWTWAIPAEKLLRLLHLLRLVLDADEVIQEVLWTLNGKILHVKPLVAMGRFNIVHLIKANSISDDRNAVIPVTDDIKKECWFWFTMLRVCSGWSAIPNPLEGLPAWALEVHTDAAGGSRSNSSLGAGIVCDGWWTVLPWARAIHLGHKTPDGKRLDRAMSALELVGPLVFLAANPNACRGAAVRVWVDNAGSVFIWKKGYSTSCTLSTTLVKAIATVATGLGCRFEIEKIARCSEPLAHMADALSKADFGRFWDVAAAHGGFNLPRQPAGIPQPVIEWTKDPKRDDLLGDKILQDIRRSGGETLGSPVRLV